MTGSPALALNVVSHKTQNFFNILIPTKVQPNVVNNISTYLVTSDYFYFQAQLTNSASNGFPAFLNQISVDGSYSSYFFQWLDDDDFNTDFWFPELKDHTQHGFFNDPITWSSRLEEHMGHFGNWMDALTATAHHMIHGKNPQYIQKPFWINAENAYNQVAKAGNVTGIDLNFGFTYDVSANNKHSSYTVMKPNYVILTS